jgi:hypothetical protein
MIADFTIEMQDNIYLLRPNTEAGRAWVQEHVPHDTEILGDAIAVEHHHLSDIAFTLAIDGLTLAGPDGDLV